MTWQRVWVAPGAIKLPPFLFDQQREACLTCSHIDRREGETMYCNAVQVGCSQARLPGERCGPDASLRNEAVHRRPHPASSLGRFLAALKAGGSMTVPQLAEALKISVENVNVVARRALAERRVTREAVDRGYAYTLVADIPQLRDAA